MAHELARYLLKKSLLSVMSLSLTLALASVAQAGWTEEELHQILHYRLDEGPPFIGMVNGMHPKRTLPGYRE